MPTGSDERERKHVAARLDKEADRLIRKKRSFVQQDDDEKQIAYPVLLVLLADTGNSSRMICCSTPAVQLRFGRSNGCDGVLSSWGSFWSWPTRSRKQLERDGSTSLFRPGRRYAQFLEGGLAVVIALSLNVEPWAVSGGWFLGGWFLLVPVRIPAKLRP